MACPKASEFKSRGNRYSLRCVCALATSAEQHQSSTREGDINTNNGLGYLLDSLLSCRSLVRIQTGSPILSASRCKSVANGRSHLVLAIRVNRASERGIRRL
jgi:hypothetical protein